MAKSDKHKIEINNRKARFNYELSDEEVAGMDLVGSEIKSIRQGKAAIRDAYCYVDDGEMVVVGMHIAEYKQAGSQGHEPYRKRRLLLTKKQIRKFEKELKVQGNTIVPIKLFINSRGLAKLKIAIAKGKKKFDKRNRILQKQTDRETKEKIDSLK